MHDQHGDRGLAREDVTRYLAGELGEILEFTYVGDPRIAWLDRIGEGDILAHVPLEKGAGPDPFQIEAALASRGRHAGDDAMRFTKTQTEYLVRIPTRADFWAILKIASSHLHWIDTDKLRIRFRNRT